MDNIDRHSFLKEILEEALDIPDRRIFQKPYSDEEISKMAEYMLSKMNNKDNFFDYDCSLNIDDKDKTITIPYNNSDEIKILKDRFDWRNDLRFRNSFIAETSALKWRDDIYKIFEEAYNKQKKIEEEILLKKAEEEKEKKDREEYERLKKKYEGK